MENKNININIKDNSDKASKNIDNMNKSFYQTKKAYDQVLKSGDSFDKQLKAIDKIVKETPLNVRDMNKQIQAYQSIALSAGRETPIGREAIEKASVLRDKYVDIQNETKRLADDHRTLNGVMELASVGVAGFGAVQSAMALAGSENEQLQRSLQKLMASQMLLNSVNQIAKSLEKESASMLLLKDLRTKILTSSTYAYATAQGVATKGLKLLRIALISTGIGALIVGVGMLIANFSKVTGFIKKGIQSFDKLGGVMKIVLLPITLVVEAFKLVGKGLQALGVIESDEAIEKRKRSQEELKRIEKEKEERAEAFRQRQLQFDREIAMLEAEGKSSFKLRQQKIQDSVAVMKQEAEELEFFLSSEGAKQLATIGTGEIIEERRKRLLELNDSIAESETQLMVNETTNNKKKLNDYKQYLSDRLSAKRKIEDIENALLKEGLDRELEINQTKFDRLIEDTKKNENLKKNERERLVKLYEEQLGQTANKIKKKFRDKEIADTKKLLADLNKLNKEQEDKKKSDLEKIRQITKNSLNAQASDVMSANELEIIATNNKYNALVKLAEKYGESTVFIEKERQREIDALNKKSVDEQKKIDQGLNDAKFDLASESFSAMSELVGAFTINNEKNAKRQFNIQKALNLAGAVTDTAKGITGALATTNPIPGGRFIEAGIVGAMGLANITKIASSKFEGSDRSVASTPSTNSGATSVQAPNFNIVGDNNINQLAELQQQPTKAYVVSSEVTSAQALDRKVEDFATL